MVAGLVVTDGLRPAEPPEMAMRAVVAVDVDEFAVSVERAVAGHTGLRGTIREMPLLAAAICFTAKE